MKFWEKSTIKHASSNWIMRYIIAIDEFLQHSLELHKCEQKIFEICTQITYEPNCVYYKQFIQTNEKHLKREFENLKFMTRLSKRSLSITSIISSVFVRLFSTNSDQDVVDELQKTDEENSDLVKTHISIMNSTMIINKQAFDRVNQRISMLNSDLLQLLNIESATILRIQLSNIIQISNLIMLDFYRAISLILKIVNRESTTSVLDLIDDDIFYSNLKNIEMNLGENEKLPFEVSNDTLFDFIRVSDLSITMSADHFHVEVHVPILDDVEYTFYRILPLPFQLDNTMNIFDRVADNIFVNFNDSSYVLVPNHNIRLCKNLNQSTLICPIQSPIYSGPGCEISALLFNNTKNCLLRRIPKRNYVVRVDEHVFFIVPVTQVQVHIHCSNGTQNTFVFYNTQEITVDSGCTLRNEDFEYTIEEEKVQNVTIQLSRNFSYNLDSSVRIKIGNLTNNTILLEELDTDFNNLTQQLYILYQRANKVPEKIIVSLNEQHLITVILWAVVIFIAAKLCCAILHLIRRFK